MEMIPGGGGGGRPKGNLLVKLLEKEKNLVCA